MVRGLKKRAADGHRPEDREYHNVKKKKLPAVEAGKKGPRAVFGVHDELV